MENSFIPGSILSLPDKEPYICAGPELSYQDSRRNPETHISSIGAKSTETMDAIKSLLKDSPFLFLFTMFRKSVEVNPRNNFPSRKMVQSSIDAIVYNELANRYSVTGLDFHLIGHKICKLDWRHDFCTYSKVVDINFNGHLTYITPCFQIINQLTALKKVTFSIGFNQHPFFLEEKEQNENEKIILSNPSVESLSIKANPKVFSRGSALEKKILDDMLEVLFTRAEECLPNLTHLDLKLPATDICQDVLQNLIHNCRFNKGETVLNFYVIVIHGMVRCHYVHITDEIQKKSILAGPGPAQTIEEYSTTLKEDVNQHFERDLRKMSDKVFKAFACLQSVAQARYTIPGGDDKEDTRFPFHDPPPGFEHLYSLVQIASVRSYHTTIQHPSSLRNIHDIDMVFDSISRHQNAIQQNIERIAVQRAHDVLNTNRTHRPSNNMQQQPHRPTPNRPNNQQQVPANNRRVAEPDLVERILRWIDNNNLF